MRHGKTSNARRAAGAKAEGRRIRAATPPPGSSPALPHASRHGACATHEARQRAGHWAAPMSPRIPSGIERVTARLASSAGTVWREALLGRGGHPSLPCRTARAACHALLVCSLLGTILTAVSCSSETPCHLTKTCPSPPTARPREAGTSAASDSGSASGTGGGSPQKPLPTARQPLRMAGWVGATNALHAMR